MRPRTFAGKVSICIGVFILLALLTHSLHCLWLVIADYNAGTKPDLLMLSELNYSLGLLLILASLMQTLLLDTVGKKRLWNRIPYWLGLVLFLSSLVILMIWYPELLPGR